MLVSYHDRPSSQGLQDLSRISDPILLFDQLQIPRLIPSLSILCPLVDKLDLIFHTHALAQRSIRSCWVTVVRNSGPLPSLFFLLADR